MKNGKVANSLVLQNKREERQTVVNNNQLENMFKFS